MLLSLCAFAGIESKIRSQREKARAISRNNKGSRKKGHEIDGSLDGRNHMIETENAEGFFLDIKNRMVKKV